MTIERNTKGEAPVIPIRSCVSDPASGVKRKARTISSPVLLSVREVQLRLVYDICGAALAGYTAAREAWTEGDNDCATLLVQKAAKALELAAEVAGEIARCP